MNALLAHDHGDLNELLNELSTALDAGDVERSHARLDLFWARLAMHIRAEHLHLFPTIIRALSENTKSEANGSPSLGEAQKTIEELRLDHDFFMHELSRAIALTRALLMQTDQQLIPRKLEDVRARVLAISERLAAHNRLEETQVYLWIDGFLTEAEQSTLGKQLQKELENMPSRFAVNTNPDV